MAPGHFITFEGGEGAGKSTQVKLLADYLSSLGGDVVQTREPGGAPGAEHIRNLLVSGATNRWQPMTEALLNYAARLEHLTATVYPALEQGRWVISDRFSDSTRAYQGYGHGIDLGELTKLQTLVMGPFAPDMTLVMDLPVEEGLRRALERGDGEDRYERMGHDFHHRLRHGFLEIAKSEPERCVVIDATAGIEEIHQVVIEALHRHFPGLAP